MLTRIAKAIQERATRLRRRCFHRPRYRLGVYAIMHNEGHVLREWLESHRREGVEHFFLVDHASTDGWEATVQDWLDGGWITVTRLPPGGAIDLLRAEHIEPALAATEWLLICDLDEFSFRTGPGTISDYLQRLPARVHQVALPWVLFGSGGHEEQPPSVVPHFLKSEDMDLRAQLPDAERPWHAKAIVRSRYLKRLHVHLHDVEGQTVVPLPELPVVTGNFFIPNRWAAQWRSLELVQNHYIHQSLAFYRRKMQRKGYWLEQRANKASYTDERWVREEALINASVNTQLLDRHGGSAAKSAVVVR